MTTQITTFIVATFLSLNLLIAQHNIEVKKLNLQAAIEMAKSNN
jgi:hypothetical protein